MTSSRQPGPGSVSTTPEPSRSRDGGPPIDAVVESAGPDPALDCVAGLWAFGWQAPRGRMHTLLAAGWTSVPLRGTRGGVVAPVLGRKQAIAMPSLPKDKHDDSARFSLGGVRRTDRVPGLGMDVPLPPPTFSRTLGSSERAHGAIRPWHGPLMACNFLTCGALARNTARRPFQRLASFTVTDPGRCRLLLVLPCQNPRSTLLIRRWPNQPKVSQTTFLAFWLLALSPRRGRRALSDIHGVDSAITRADGSNTYGLPTVGLARKCA